MTTWSVPAVARFWISNGGNPDHVINATAVSMAESGGNDRAVSPADDWGLWQINSLNFRAQGVTKATILDPNLNARVAIRMSGNGSNWGAWCTAYTPGQNRCGLDRVPVLQPDSPAADQLPMVLDALAGLVGHDPIQQPPGADDEITGAWTYFQDFVGRYSSDLQQYFINTNNAIRRL